MIVEGCQLLVGGDVVRERWSEYFENSVDVSEVDIFNVRREC